ncbi:uncharacterized protein LOC135812032 isoform X2 [Sycon ciliatum]|uniref:uncharacterized protein LOC135812032 isoform X2 n=1 Tax=Sycon ciliatum TaxID=27933 RepID=UPI0031F6AF01
MKWRLLQLKAIRSLRSLRNDKLATEMVVLQEHRARSNFELSCPVGAIVLVVCQDDPLLWRVNYQDRQGLVPSSCFQPAPADEPSLNPYSSNQTHSARGRRHAFPTRPSALSLPTLFESEAAQFHCLRQALTPPPSRRAISWFWPSNRRRHHRTISSEQREAAMAAQRDAPVPPLRPAHTFVEVSRNDTPRRRLSMTRSAGLPSDCRNESPMQCGTALHFREHSDATRSISLPAGYYLVKKNDTSPNHANTSPQSRAAKAKAKLTRLFNPTGKMNRPLPVPPEDDVFQIMSPPMHTTCHIAGQRANGQPVFAHHPVAVPTGERAGLRRMASWSGNGSVSMVSKETLSEISRQQRHSVSVASQQQQQQQQQQYHSGHQAAHCQCCWEQQQQQQQQQRQDQHTSCTDHEEHDVVETRSPCRRKPLTRASSNPGQFSDSFSPQASMQSRRKKRSFDESAKYRAFDWFFGRMTRDRAELLLIKYGKDEDYLLREREVEPGTYAIAVRASSTLVRHFRVFESNHGYSCNPNSDTQCPSLVDLVLHHEKHALHGAGAAADSYYLYHPLDRSTIPLRMGIPPVLDGSEAASFTSPDYHNSPVHFWNQTKNYVESNSTRPQPAPRSEANLPKDHRSPTNKNHLDDKQTERTDGTEQADSKPESKEGITAVKKTSDSRKEKDSLSSSQTAKEHAIEISSSSSSSKSTHEGKSTVEQPSSRQAATSQVGEEDGNFPAEPVYM